MSRSAAMSAFRAITDCDGYISTYQEREDAMDVPLVPRYCRSCEDPLALDERSYCGRCISAARARRRLAMPVQRRVE